MLSSPLRQLPRAAQFTPFFAQSRNLSTSARLCRAFQEGDVVLLREKRDNHDGRLVKLKAAQSIHTHRGVIQHDDIIGKESRQIIQSSKGATHRVIEPTLADYVRLTPRIVTPLYPSDTNLIVSLLDINVDKPSDDLDSEPPLEILEAGTGHGALTLHLSRAIHAANPPLPKTPSITTTEEEPEDAVYLGESMSDLGASAVESWKQNRRAIIHTLDISSKHSQHAKKIVQGFRHGMYSGNVDFHVGDVSDWIAEQQASRKTDKPFLAHVFLDLPNATKHLANVAPALHVNGLLAVFNPSITQIAECVVAIREQKMPYLLDQVIELGTGTIREWDVRAVRTKASVRKAGADQLSEPSGDEGVDSEQGQAARDSELEEELSKQEEAWVMVCRPKAGEMIVGGGFLGLWRLMDRTSTKESSD